MRAVAHSPVLVALLVSTAFVSLILTAAQQRRDARAVARSTETVAQIERVQRLATDLEASLRGYVITGQEPFLAPYWDARAAFPTEARRLGDGPIAERLLRNGQAYSREYADRVIASQRHAWPDVCPVQC